MIAFARQRRSVRADHLAKFLIHFEDTPSAVEHDWQHKLPTVELGRFSQAADQIAQRLIEAKNNIIRSVVMHGRQRKRRDD